ncbi:hypothetical protein [Hyphococcus luteus]|uniref:Uncharacterized protein n=1 Tax=Hyphococcus luteus TaxID=2058213 RepID=A0A2S7JYR8_9PROT|nr:hypothetical protein [Marinicaulis flavus]PQA85395.1 hypothetical protein CW354_20830 [Marinicaulis flavus]
MAVADFFTALGAGDLFSGGFTLLELTLAAILTFLFAGSLALSVLAARSAAAARQARGEAREALAAVREQAAEFRALAGDLERTASDLAASQAELKDLQAAAAARQDYSAEAAAETPEEASQDTGSASGPAPIERRFDPLPPRERAETADEGPSQGGKSALFRGLLRRR